MFILFMRHLLKFLSTQLFKMGILKYVTMKPKDQYLENQWQTKQNCTWELFLKYNSALK